MSVRTSAFATLVSCTLIATALFAAVRHPNEAGQAPTVVLGPEVLASANDDGGWLRVEPSVVLAGETVVVAWNDSWAGRVRGSSVGVGIAWSSSSDGGRSFKFGGYMPGASGADSWLSATRSGEILLQVLSWSTAEQTITVYALTPGLEQAWTRRGVAAGGTPESRVDKPAMATQGNDWVGIAYSAGSEIHAVRSIDRGATWTRPARVSAADTRLRTGAAIAACGTHVLVAWAEGSGLALSEFWAAWSADSGRTFAEAARVHRLESPVKPPPGYALGVGPAARIINNAWLACSGSEEPVFHLTYGEGRESGSVVLLSSAQISDANLHWEAPAIIAGGDSIWAVWPSITLLDQGLGILYYDSRHSERGRPVMDAYLSIGTSRAFVDYRLSTVSTSWPDLPGDREHAPVQRNVGDYISLTSEGRRGIAAWTDGRTGAPRIMARSFEIGAQSHR